ncbi:hypothetical protein [Streptomyces sp. NPDC051561]|uniref:hypothetical protein n=1 Tax=Streptomyces sp. NPDC051561 TaxID=3365658 RepID=UPI0037B10B82
MNLLRPSRSTSLAAVVSSADIARLAGLSRGRITQLRAPGATDPLPLPDAEASTDQRPLWRGSTVARWCAATGRRLDPRTASWLLPGPDGPRLRLAERRTVQLRQEAKTGADLRRPPIDVQLDRYTDTQTQGPSVWLATVLTPSESNRLWGWPPFWLHGSPLNNLVHEVLDGLEGMTAGPGGLLGTVVVAPTESRDQFGSLPGLVRVLDLFAVDAVRAGKSQEAERFDRRLRTLPVSAPEMADLAQALGHRLAWWAPGCATPVLATAWKPGAPAAADIPPALAEADAFRQRCLAVAAKLEGSLAASVRELGETRWGQATGDWRPGYEGGHSSLPTACDPRVWEPAVRFGLSGELHPYTGDFWQGLDWLMEQAPSRRLAQDAQRVFGDPNSARTVLLDTALLPAPAAPHLTSAVAPAGPSTSHRAQCVLETLDAHPLGAAGTRLGTWPAPAGPAWCATAPGTPLIALHVPRELPVPGPSVGAYLEAVVLPAVDPAAEAGHISTHGVALVVTDQDQVVVLPEYGRADRLAAVVEHTVWHPGTRVLSVGLAPSTNSALNDALDSLLRSVPQCTPWEHLAGLVGPHPTNRYCPYCPSEEQ